METPESRRRERGRLDTDAPEVIFREANTGIGAVTIANAFSRHGLRVLSVSHTQDGYEVWGEYPPGDIPIATMEHLDAEIDHQLDELKD